MSIQIRSKKSVGAVLLILAFTSTARADDDSLALYRERFKTGFEHYKAGQVAEAIRYWEPIYRELGRAKGFRLAFNLARAYETYGDFTRAAEFYDSFLAETDARQKLGEAIDPLVRREETEARARLAELAATKGRIQVNAGKKPVSVRIDGGESRVAGFVAFVPPGVHTLVLGTESPEKREITTAAGEIVVVTPLPPAEVVEVASPPAPVASAPLPPPLRLEKRTEHPFSPAVLYVAGGVTLASVLVPVITRASAISYQKSHSISSDPGTEVANASTRSDYTSASTAYYATLAVPITLAALTGGLVAWYFVGTKERSVPVFAAGPTRGGASLGISGSF